MQCVQNDGPATYWVPQSDIKMDANCIIHTTDEQVQPVYRNHPLFTRRQLAEIQLEGIVNDPELVLPHLANDETTFEIDELAIRLRTQPWIIQRVLRTLGIFNTEILSTRDVHILTRVLTGSFDARALLFFDMIDIDGNRQVTREEFMKFFTDYLDGITSQKIFNEAEDGERRQTILKIILEKFNLNQTSYINFDQFHELVVNDQLLIEALSRFTVHPTWFNVNQTQTLKETSNNNESKDRSSWTIKGAMLRILQNRVSMYQTLHDDFDKILSSNYLYENINQVLFFVIYLAISIALFIYVLVYRVRQNNHWLEIIAHISGMQLNLNCMLLIVLMLRHMISFIQSNRILRTIIPVDNTISIHKMVGYWIVVLVVIHALCHMIYYGVEGQGHLWAEIMFTARAKIGWFQISPLLRILLIVVLCIMVICSMRFVRRGAYFEVFYWTHRLYILIYILLIFHAQNFWCWFIGPAVIFVLEKVYDLYKGHSINKGYTLLHSVTIEQANVVKLNIHRPPNFHFLPGDYILLNIPQVARYEWHPFTTSSVPENQKVLTIHVQPSGNWTNKVFNRYNQIVADSPRALEANDAEAATERIWIDGPYASNARNVFDCAHVVLIGAGIGITPYDSILSSLLSQYRNRHSSGPLSGSQRRLVKVDFVWINRSIDKFEWFLKLLANFEQEQEYYESIADRTNENTVITNNGRFLDIHLYFTDIKQDVNIGSVPLDLVTRVYEQACNEDIFTRLKAKTHIGRPNWDELFKKILPRDSNNRKKDVNVFFCGPQSMGEVVKAECIKHKLKFYKEQF